MLAAGGSGLAAIRVVARDADPASGPAEAASRVTTSHSDCDRVAPCARCRRQGTRVAAWRRRSSQPRSSASPGATAIHHAPAANSSSLSLHASGNILRIVPTCMSANAADSSNIHAMPKSLNLALPALARGTFWLPKSLGRTLLSWMYCRATMSCTKMTGASRSRCAPRLRGVSGLRHQCPHPRRAPGRCRWLRRPRGVHCRGRWRSDEISTRAPPLCNWPPRADTRPRQGPPP